MLEKLHKFGEGMLKIIVNIGETPYFAAKLRFSTDKWKI